MAKKRQHRLPGPKLKMPDLVVLGHLTDQQARVSFPPQSGHCRNELRKDREEKDRGSCNSSIGFNAQSMSIV